MNAPSHTTAREAGSREVLLREAERAVRAARRSGRPRWLAWRRPQTPHDPLDALAGAVSEAEGSEDVFCYAVPEEGFALAAVGAAARFEAAGAERFAALESARRELDLQVAGDAPREAGPLLWAGAAFRDRVPASREWTGFPAAALVLPRVLHVRDGDRAWSCAVSAVAPDDVPDALAHRLEALGLRGPSAPARAPAVASGDAGVRLEPAGGAARHRRNVERALADIRAGELEKVVVARALDVERDAPFDALALLRTLRALHPACASFAVRRAGAWLVGASPERLLERRGRRARAVALAGSAPRGRTPDDDARLRRSLVESKKEQAEHAVVVRALRDGLEPLCASLRVPEAPRVLALDGVQHLRTTLDGRLRGSPGLLELAARVHPTPAVAGAPADAALAWLDRHEGLERGWYAGLVGWMTPDGDGELSAALRCALLRGGRARLFAGGGIVAGSDPEAELAETRLKWNALLPALLEL